MGRDGSGGGDGGSLGGRVLQDEGTETNLWWGSGARVAEDWQGPGRRPGKGRRLQLGRSLALVGGRVF